MNAFPWFESQTPDPNAPRPFDLPLDATWAQIEAAFAELLRGRPL